MAKKVLRGVDTPTVDPIEIAQDMSPFVRLTLIVEPGLSDEPQVKLVFSSPVRIIQGNQSLICKWLEQLHDEAASKPPSCSC